MSDPDNLTNDLDHSRLFDVHKSSPHPEVRSLVDRIYDDHFRTGNQNVQKRHIKTIILDLYVAWREDPDLKIAVSRNNNSYLARSRYNELFISRLVIDVVDTLVTAGLLNERRGYLDRERGIGRVSRIWPTEALITIFEDALFGILDIGNQQDRECIILRDADKNDIEYDPSPETDRMREILTGYNELLKSTFIDIPIMETSWINVHWDAPEPRDRVYLSQSDKFVRRIFSRGSFELGGRFAGGWWQRCPKQARALIFLDDCATSEIDFSSLHPALLYAQLGINYWEQTDDDLYTVERPDFIETDEQCRQCCKRLLLIAINARDEASMYSAFRDPRHSNEIERRFTNEQIGILFDRLREKHEPISGYIASDAGVGLMFIESQILERVIDHFVRQQVPVLTVHDSYIVPHGFEDELIEVMGSAFADVTGVPGVRMQEVTERVERYEPLELDDGFNFAAALTDRYDPPRSERYRHHWNAFRVHWGKPEETWWERQAGWASEMG